MNVIHSLSSSLKLLLLRGGLGRRIATGILRAFLTCGIFSRPVWNKEIVFVEAQYSKIA